MGIRDRPTAPRSPWQNGHVERLIGSIRREALDHLVVFGEAHLRDVLKAYASYYNKVRTFRRRTDGDRSFQWTESAVAKEDTSLETSNEAEEAAVKRIVVVEGDQVPGHPKFTELGRVQGVCVRAPWYDDDSSIARVGFKHAAYDRYGDKVDAIIRVDSFFVTDNQSYGKSFEPRTYCAPVRTVGRANPRASGRLDGATLDRAVADGEQPPDVSEPGPLVLAAHRQIADLMEDQAVDRHWPRDA